MHLKIGDSGRPGNRFSRDDAVHIIPSAIKLTVSLHQTQHDSEEILHEKYTTVQKPSHRYNTILSRQKRVRKLI